MKKVVIGGDHRGVALKEKIKSFLTKKGFEVLDVGSNSTDSVDYPDIASELVKQMRSGESDKGILICGSGVGACVAANKFKGIRAAICHDVFSAHQGVEDDAMNVLCIGGGIIGDSLAAEITEAFLNAKFITEERYIRRLEKVKKIEESE
jgi:ribose 5-phosphate isomerase B